MGKVHICFRAKKLEAVAEEMIDGSQITRFFSGGGHISQVNGKKKSCGDEACKYGGQKPADQYAGEGSGADGPDPLDNTHPQNGSDDCLGGRNRHT